MADFDPVARLVELRHFLGLNASAMNRAIGAAHDLVIYNWEHRRASINPNQLRSGLKHLVSLLDVPESDVAFTHLLDYVEGRSQSLPWDEPPAWRPGASPERQRGRPRKTPLPTEETMPRKSEPGFQERITWWVEQIGLPWLKQTTGDDSVRALTRAIGESHPVLYNWMKRGFTPDSFKLERMAEIVGMDNPRDTATWLLRGGDTVPTHPTIVPKVAAPGSTMRTVARSTPPSVVRAVATNPVPAPPTEEMVGLAMDAVLDASAPGAQPLPDKVRQLLHLILKNARKAVPVLAVYLAASLPAVAQAATVTAGESGGTADAQDLGSRIIRFPTKPAKKRRKKTGT